LFLSHINFFVVVLPQHLVVDPTYLVSESVTQAEKILEALL